MKDMQVGRIEFGPRYVPETRTERPPLPTTGNAVKSPHRPGQMRDAEREFVAWRHGKPPPAL